ncbi:MAG: hypothetical protein K6T87_18295 [Roseiflexus sp.]|jgi:hypothetical protein|uniref:hypothetical protein n=1 Tax=Roseiflexus sp. TaxID=2562120 RepID=UPI0025FA12DE|nr:hypothetical protein [Roseiflexus sp.]MCL6542510.1 hypothetical protein [Roseiflexus sp.]
MRGRWGQRFTALAISLIYRGSAIPLAWVMLLAPTQGARRLHREQMFTLIQPEALTGWTVIVVADRGL